jgi:Ca2+-transporting ATPase
MRMATFHRVEDGLEVAVKGATGAVLEACDDVATDPAGRDPLDEAGRQRWKERAESLADEGLRVLAVADKRVDAEDAEPYAGLRLVGLVGLLDPPREGVREAIEACRSAGIRVLVVTGDQAETARAIAREVGLGSEGGITVLEGEDLPEAEEGMSDEVRRRIRETDVFARLSPKQKLDLVSIYQDSGEVVAMTGDGVNDAPALKKADIGVAMGRRGTEAARQVSDMILRDDAFASIVAAVEQGRIIFGNIRKAVVFMLCTNGAEILAVAVASFASIPLPLRPLQILYLNVLTDVLPALALGVGAGSSVVMQRPPRAAGQSVLTRSHWLAIGGWSCTIAAVVLGALWLAHSVLGLEGLAAVTVSFLTLGLAKLWFVFNLRDPDARLADDDVLTNPWIWSSIAVCIGLLGAAVYAPGLSYVLETRPLWLSGVGVALGMSFVPAALGQALRLFRRLR